MEEGDNETTLRQPLLLSTVAPLLPEENDAESPAQASNIPPLSTSTSLPGSVILLSKAIVGAGAAALPLAFARLGLLFSVTFLLTIAYITHVSLEALTLGIVASGTASYPSSVRYLLGHSAATFLELCLVLRCAGLIIVYIVISADLLAGSTSLPGLICEFTDAGWCGNRHLIAGVITLLVVVPLVTPRKLSSATITSFLGLSAVVLWTVATVALAIAAVFVHRTGYSPTSLFPDIQPGQASQYIVLLATLPVIATAYTCQMTVAFIISELRNFSTKRMSFVSATAVSLCSIIFLVVGLGSIVAFGDKKVPADILELFNADILADLVGTTAGSVLAVAVRVGFLVSILANMPIQMLPFRQSLARLTIGDDYEFSGTTYYLVSYVSVAVFYMVAMAAKSIWVPIQLVGATAGAAIAFFFPAAVALSVLKLSRRGDIIITGLPSLNISYWKWNSWALVALGVIQAVTGVAAVIIERKKA